MLIIQCTYCGNLLLSKIGQKTKTCIYCKRRLVIDKVKKIYKAKNAYEATKIIQKLKKKIKLKKSLAYPL